MDVLRALGLNNDVQPSVPYPILGSNSMGQQLMHSQQQGLNNNMGSMNGGGAPSLAGLDFLDSGKLATLSNLLHGGALNGSSEQNSIEKAAKMYRNAAGMRLTCFWKSA